MLNAFLSVLIYLTILMQMICKYISGGIQMKKMYFRNMMKGKFASILSTALCAVLFVCANTNSCFMIHQPQAPDELHKFSKMK